MKGIYQYMDLKTGDIVYVGKDSHIDKQLRHKDHLKPSTYDKQPFNRVLQNNPERYEYSVVYAGDYDDDLLNVLEINTIAEVNPKFNFTNGGDGSTGFKHSEESKKKISESKKGKNHPNYGKRHSDETKVKMSKSRNTTGYLNVCKRNSKRCKQRFIFGYSYWEDGKRKEIQSISIDKLEEKVKAKGLKWVVL